MPAELLGSNEMMTLIVALRAEYDFIIIDTPPVLTVTDSQVLIPNRWSYDGIALWRSDYEGRRPESRSFASGGKLLGAVLNPVDYKSPDYAEYYGRSYKDYYSSKTYE